MEAQTHQIFVERVAKEDEEKNQIDYSGAFKGDL